MKLTRLEGREEKLFAELKQFEIVLISKVLNEKYHIFQIGYLFAKRLAFEACESYWLNMLASSIT